MPQNVGKKENMFFEQFLWLCHTIRLLWVPLIGWWSQRDFFIRLHLLNTCTDVEALFNCTRPCETVYTRTRPCLTILDHVWFLLEPYWSYGERLKPYVHTRVNNIVTWSCDIRLLLRVLDLGLGSGTHSWSGLHVRLYEYTLYTVSYGTWSFTVLFDRLYDHTRTWIRASF